MVRQLKLHESSSSNQLLRELKKAVSDKGTEIIKNIYSDKTNSYVCMP